MAQSFLSCTFETYVLILLRGNVKKKKFIHMNARQFMNCVYAGFGYRFW